VSDDDAGSAEPQAIGVWAQPSEWETGFLRWANRAIHDLMRARNDLYASIRRDSEAVGERSGPVAGQFEGDPRLHSPLYKPIAVQQHWIMRIDDAVNFQVDEFLANLVEVADGMASQVTVGMIEHISEISDRYEMTIDAAGRDVRDVLLDALEGMDISFDDEGNHNLKLLMHPDTLERIKDREFTPEQQARHDSIVQRKRDEWNASQRRRDLPGLVD
jgi:hypothetical protein